MNTVAGDDPAGPISHRRRDQMLLFMFALAVAALGMAGYAHYNPGTQDITIRTYHLVGVPNWEVVAVAAGVPLFVFLLQAIYSGAHIRSIKAAGRGTAWTSR